MFRKFFWIVVFLLGYVWIMSYDDGKGLYTKAVDFYKFCQKTAEKNDVELHIHTIECLKNKNQKR